MIGRATNAATVTVNDQPTYRKGDYFRTDYQLNNSTGAVSVSLTNLAILNNGSADISTNTIGTTFVPKTPQIFGYDVDGNLTNDGRWILTWDGENRLIAMTNTANEQVRSLTFNYDSQGRRTRKTVYNLSGVLTKEQKFAYDRWNLVAELNATNSAPTQSFMWGTDLSGTMQGAGGVGGLLVANSGTATQFFAYDGNGNVAAIITASTGEVAARYEYSLFGETLRAEGALAEGNPFRFSTKYEDEESTFLYYGHRYYAAATGRWPNRDPLAELAGNGIYRFISNDPNNSVDLLGLWQLGPFWFGPEPKWIDPQGNYRYDPRPDPRPPSSDEWQDESDAYIDQLQARSGGIQKVCKTIKTTAHSALELTPQNAASEAVFGESLSGEKVGTGGRLMAAATMLPGAYALKELVGKTVTLCCGKKTVCVFIKRAQRHHLIPKARFRDNDLVKAAGVNIDKDGDNLMDLINHGGDHTGEYYDRVQRLLDEALREVQSGNVGALEAYKGVCTTLRQGITDGSIKPYRSTDVFALP